MPRTSRKPIKTNIRLELTDHFISLISMLHNSKDIEEFFKDFLSSEESSMLTKRLMLHIMLENNYKNSEIESLLGITRETIRVHKNIWSRGGVIYKKIIEKIAKKEETKRFLEKVDRMFKPIDLVMKAKSNMKARAKLAQGDFN